MTIETLKSSNPRNRNSISVIKSKFLADSSINTLLAMKVTDARRDVIVAGRLYHRTFRSFYFVIAFMLWQLWSYLTNEIIWPILKRIVIG